MVSLGLAIGAYVVVCIAVIAVLVLGPNRDQRDSVLGKAFRCVSKLPTVIGLGCCLLCSCCNIGKAEGRWAACEEKSFHRKNPALLIFYIALVWTVEGLYLWFVAPTLTTGHCSFGFAMVLIGEYYFIRAWWCDPGVITPIEAPEGEGKKNAESDAKRTKKRKPSSKTSSLSSAEELKQNCRYDFDGFMYACVSGNGYGDASHGAECYTCHVPRPSRSKHCSMCGHCVRRFDHHCPWINNDVGEGSLRYFIYFVAWHVVACFKGGYDCVMHCLSFLEERRVWKSQFVSNSGERVGPTWGIVVMFLLQHRILVACVALFAILVGFMLLWFLYHHVAMMAKNVTTNDETKIDVIMDYVDLLHNYAVNREELSKMQSKMKEGSAAFDPKLLEEREERLKQTLWNLENHPPSFMDPRAASRLRSEILGMNLGGPAVPAKEHRRRRTEASKVFKKELYKTFSLGSVWLNIKDSMWPYGNRPKPAAKVSVTPPVSELVANKTPQTGHRKSKK